jgi:DNA-binding protein H-NS
MATYIEMKKQAERLMAEAEALRMNELVAVIGQIKAEIKAYNLTPKDLGFSMPATIKGRKVPAKYRDPVSGKTWSGRGRTPLWVNGSVQQYAI